MRSILVTRNAPILIGRRGENLATCILFDITDWRETYGDGQVELLHQRNGDESPYPCVITIDENDYVVWTITSGDTGIAGHGKCELRYMANDTLAKSVIYPTIVENSIDDGETEPPEPEKGWVQQVLDAKADAEAAAEKTEEAIIHSPMIGENGNWFVWNTETQEYVDTGVCAEGYTPKKGVDYWTPGDKSEVKSYVDKQTEVIKSDVEGLQKQINEEAHFRGYLANNAKIQALEATPNDFAYSAESGTKWVYDAEDGWIDTGTPVPDQLTPASDAPPLMNGEASAGSENAYARGDHRHPTDTTRASAESVELAQATADDAYDMAHMVARDVYNEQGTIAQDYQKKWYKVTELSEDNTDEDYPSAKAVYNGIQAKTSWELVKNDTLTQDVQIISNTFDKKYKELYVHFIIPSMLTDEVTSIDKGRVTLYAGKRYENQIFMESVPTYVDNGSTYPLTFHIQLFGKYCRVQRYYKTNASSTYYESTAVVNSGYADIGQEYIDMLTLEFMPTTRKFVAGTTYEIWGVRA